MVHQPIHPCIAGTELSRRDYQADGMDGFSAIAIGSNGSSVSRPIAPIQGPPGSLGHRRRLLRSSSAPQCLDPGQGEKGMNQRNVARYRSALEAARAQLMACNHNPGSFAMERASDPTEESDIGNERHLGVGQA
jgi:hypothetical protein